MLFLLHKRKTSLFDYEGQNAARISDYRRFDHRYVNHLVMFLLGVALLSISVRIGVSISFYFTQVWNDGLILALQKTEPPYSKHHDYIENKRLLFYVTIEKDGKYRFLDEYLALENLIEVLPYSGSRPSIYTIGIVADNNCKMEYILDLVEVLRKNKFYKITFVTYKHNPLKKYK